MIVVNGRYKACADCGEVKGRQAFYRYAHGSHDRKCKLCRRAHVKRNRAAVLADPERHARQRKMDADRKRKRWASDPAFAEAQRAAHRRWWASRPSEVRLVEAQNQRIRYRLRKEQEGIAVARRNSTALGAYAATHDRHHALAVEPLLSVLPDDFHGPDHSSVARALYRIRSGESQTVTLSVADQILVAAGLHYLLGVLYPDD